MMLPAGFFILLSFPKENRLLRSSYCVCVCVCIHLKCASNNTGQQNLTFIFGQRTSIGELSSTFMLNSDMHTEFFYQTEFQRYIGLYLCKLVLCVLMKQAEVYLQNVETYDFRR